MGQLAGGPGHGRRRYGRNAEMVFGTCPWDDCGAPLRAVWPHDDPILNCYHGEDLVLQLDTSEILAAVGLELAADVTQELIRTRLGPWLSQLHQTGRLPLPEVTP